MIPQINHTYVINLKEETGRHQHIIEHFNKFDINPYSFVEATPADSERVKKYYRQDKVIGYPGCFRVITCRKYLGSCSHNCNNIIVPQQVANWDSFLRVFDIITQREDGLYLICEDDVHFYDYAPEALTTLLPSLSLDLSQPILIRMALSGQTTSPPPYVGISYNKREIMSNAAFIINNKMARHYLQNFTIIPTTSDVWFHRDMKDTIIQSYATVPLLATDLSANINYAKFLSCIHPKGLDEQDRERMKTHIRKVETVEEYLYWREKWKE